MSRTSRPKSSKKQDTEKQARTKGRYKNQDKHRWRKVAVWLIPLIFAIFFAYAVSSHGILLVWASVASAITLLGYTLFLLEWYVWREKQERRKIRIAFAVLSLVVVGAGFIWQARTRSNPTLDIVDRPYVTLTELGIANLEAGKTPTVIAVFQNSGKTPALKTVFYTCAQPRGRTLPEPPEPCATNTALPYEAAAPVFVPPNGTSRMVLPMKGTVTPDDLKRIESGISLIYVWGTVTYEDGAGEGHTLTYCGIYKPEIKSFSFCPFYNESN